MRNLSLVLVGITLLVAGCGTMDPGIMGESMGEPASKPEVEPAPEADAEQQVAKSGRSIIGKPIDDVLAPYRGERRIEIFDDDGKRVPEIPAGERGSVSIYGPEGQGQDNYTFEKDGRISKHMRSAGDDFVKGEWTTVAE